MSHVEIDACYFGDVRDGLRAYAAAGIKAQTCVTSPPYWGLRDYGTAEWDGGSVECDHANGRNGATRRDVSPERLAERAAMYGTGTGAGSDVPPQQFRDVCGKCGARRVDRQIGLEPTIGEYMQTMVDVFRLVRDVLADDGVLWLNLGDSYAANRSYQVPDSARCDVGNNHGSKITDGLKPKDLCGVPWRVAFALQADGWYLRQDIIWAKPNPMPESVTDRCTKSHEYLFLLSKRERYYFDSGAMQEQASRPEGAGNVRAQQIPGQRDGANSNVINGLHKVGPRETRNRRSVWTINTESYAEAHFATFPRALVAPCIAAGSRTGDIVLDPFMGSGTVAQVAQTLGRRWVGCELNPDYIKLQSRRAAQTGMAFA